MRKTTERAAMIAGAGSFVVAAGLQVSGYQNPYAGAALVVLGVICWVFAGAMVVAGYRRGYCLSFVTDHRAMNVPLYATDDDEMTGGSIDSVEHRIVLTNTCDEVVEWAHVTIIDMVPRPNALGDLIPGAEIRPLATSRTIVKDQVREFTVFGYPDDYGDEIFINVDGKWISIPPRRYEIVISALANGADKPAKQRFRLEPDGGRGFNFSAVG